MTPEAVVDQILTDRNKLSAYIWSMVRDFHATEDIFQEVVLTAMANAEEICSPAHLASWIRQSARFKCIDWLRHQKRKPVQLNEDVMNLLENQWRELDQLSSKAWTDALRRCTEMLSEYAQKLLDLRYVEGLSGLEVARRMGRTPRTVYVALSRIYKQLEDCIQTRLSSESDSSLQARQ